MLIALLLGAVLIGLLTGSGPYVDAKGMVGCSNVTYMLSKGISMMLILVIDILVFTKIMKILVKKLKQERSTANTQRATSIKNISSRGGSVSNAYDVNNNNIRRNNIL